MHSARFRCTAGLAALKIEYDVAKNPGVFNVLAELSADQLIEQVLARNTLNCCGCAQPFSVCAAH